MFPEMDIHLNSFGCMGLDMLTDQAFDDEWILIGDESARHFGEGFTGDDGLDSFAGIAGLDAVDFQCGPRPSPFQGGVPFFSRQRGHPDLLHQFILIDREGEHVVIKTVNRDLPFFVAHGGEQLDQGMNGVLHRSTKHASGMQIDPGAFHFDFKTEQSPQGITNRRLIST